MHAQVLKAFGSPENLELRDIPRPQVKPGPVLIRVFATSVNPVDVKICEGLPIAAVLAVTGTAESCKPSANWSKPASSVLSSTPPG